MQVEACHERLAWPLGLLAALGQGEDDALVDGAAFQLAVGLGGLPHGHGLVRAQAEPASRISEARVSV